MDVEVPRPNGMGVTEPGVELQAVLDVVSDPAQLPPLVVFLVPTQPNCRPLEVCLGRFGIELQGLFAVRKGFFPIALRRCTS